jgi:hypothetical protein
LRLLGDLEIHARAANLVEELDHGDVRAETRPHRRHLEADDAAANDRHLLGHLLQGDGTRARNDALLVNLEAGERRRLAACRDENVLADHARLAAVVELDLDRVLVLEGARALDVLDAVLLEQELDALGQAVDRLVLGLHQLLEVQLDVADLDAAVFRVVEDLVVEMRVVEERFRGDAADVEAGAAEGSALLDTCDLEGRARRAPVSFRVGVEWAMGWGGSSYLHPLLAGLDSGDIAGHTAADDDQVLLLCDGVSGVAVKTGRGGGFLPAADANVRFHRAEGRTLGRLGERVSTSGILSCVKRISLPGRTECRPRQRPAYYSLRKHGEMCAGSV